MAFPSRHLRERHCTREGGSYVCRYGQNGVCSSLPVDGVCDADYEDHVQRHHIGSSRAVMRPLAGHSSQAGGIEGRKMSGNLSRRVSYSDAPHLVTEGSKWTVYSGSQNLPAVLNDPNRGKQVSSWFEGQIVTTKIVSCVFELTRCFLYSYRKIFSLSCGVIASLKGLTFPLHLTYLK